MVGQCPHCSKPIPMDAAFCPNCGGRLTVSPVTTAPIAPPVLGAVAVEPGRRRGPILLVAVGVIALLAVGAYVALGKVGQPGSVSPVATAPPASGVSVACKTTLQPFTDSLTELDSRLAVGLNFSEYSDKVGAAKVAYDRLPFSSLDTTCVSQVGALEEDAFNDYVHAYNTWNDCVGKVGCSNDSIKSSLQGDWSKATDLLTTVRSRLP